MKKLKKLVLKKEAISNLNSGEMNKIQGGYGTLPDLTCQLGSAAQYIANTICYAPNKTDGCPDTPPDTGINECPQATQQQGYDGCQDETCGWAYTCNGR